MAREILFKAKRIDNGEWVEGLLTVMWGQYHIINPNDENTAYPIDSDTICQYTGLTDKNGNKIWENDVVEVWWDNKTLVKPDQRKKYKAVVEFGNPNGFYNWGYQLHFIEHFPFNEEILHWIDTEEALAYCEVIGNIFDNNELLGGGRQ